MKNVYSFDFMFDADKSHFRLSTITLENVISWAEKEDNEINTITDLLLNHKQRYE